MKIVLSCCLGRDGEEGSHSEKRAKPAGSSMMNSVFCLMRPCPAATPMYSKATVNTSNQVSVQPKAWPGCPCAERLGVLTVSEVELLGDVLRGDPVDLFEKKETASVSGAGKTQKLQDARQRGAQS